MVKCDGCGENYKTISHGGFFVTYVYPQHENEIPDVWRCCCIPCIHEALKERVR
jgi:hypothetical protein